MSTSINTPVTTLSEQKIAEPQIFHGHPNEDPVAWKRQFLACARVNRWNTWDRNKDILGILLREEALEWFYTEEDNWTTQAEFEIAFNNKWLTDEKKQAWEYMLMHRRQQQGENIQAIITDIQSL